MRRSRRVAAVVMGGIAVASAVLACGAERLPAPPYVGQPTSALVRVPYPPPPARVEQVPPAPAGAQRAVWLDGEWVWEGRRYAWKPGRWVRAPEQGAFSPWTTVRDREGTLYLAQGAWRGPDGRELAPPPLLRTGGARPGSITDPEGATFDPPTIVDAGLLPPPDAMQLPDGTLSPTDSAILPEAAGFEPIDARIDMP